MDFIATASVGGSTCAAAGKLIHVAAYTCIAVLQLAEYKGRVTMSVSQRVGNPEHAYIYMNMGVSEKTNSLIAVCCYLSCLSPDQV